MNPYLKALNDKYNAMRDSIAGIQTRAAAERRDLSDEEMRSVTEQSAASADIAQQIETLADIETRNAAVAATASRVTEALGAGDQQARAAVGGDDKGTQRLSGTTQTRDRDPGHYTKSSKHSFFSDLYRSKEAEDDQAKTRLVEHTRALDTAGEGVGLVAPKWLTEEFETLARQGRVVANAVRNIGLGDDPRPMTLPKQTAGTDAVVAEQAAENDPVAGTDAFDTDVDVVAPKPTAGKQLFSRQMLDMASPAIDQLIYGDLMAVYNLKVENKVCAALIAAAGTAVTTFATNAAFSASNGSAATDAVIDAATTLREQRKLPPNIMAMTVRRWSVFKKFRDTAGRPIIPTQNHGPANVSGIGSVLTDGEVEGLPVLTSDGMGNGSTYPESIVIARSTDTLLFESNVMRFKFEEQAGPESIVVGIWGYTAVIVRQAGKSVKRIVVTAAT